MKLTGKEARAVVWEYSEEWVPASDEMITDHSRWSIETERVFKHIKTGRFYMFSWSVGATEQQDEQPFEYDTFYVPQEVVKKEVVKSIWVNI